MGKKENTVANINDQLDNDFDLNEVQQLKDLTTWEPELIGEGGVWKVKLTNLDVDPALLFSYDEQQEVVEEQEAIRKVVNLIGEKFPMQHPILVKKRRSGDGYEVLQGNTRVNVLRKTEKERVPVKLLEILWIPEK